MNYGFIRVAAAVPELKVAECSYNADKIIEMIKKADDSGVQIIVFPELSLTAYTCGDLFRQQLLLYKAPAELKRVADSTRHLNITAIVGLPLLLNDKLFNCAAVLQKGEISGIVPKTYIQNYKGFCEGRWFVSGACSSGGTVRLFGKDVPFGADLLFESPEGPDTVCFGVETGGELSTPIPPSSYQAVAGASIIFNLSAACEIAGAAKYRRETVKQQSGRCIAGYVYASSGVDESTTDAVFGGHALIAENGVILEESERFLRDGHMIISEIDVGKLLNYRSRSVGFMDAVPGRSFRKVMFDVDGIDLAESGLMRVMDPYPFVPSDKALRDERCREISDIQAAGLAKRLAHTGIRKAILGISGGLDSTLALLITVRAFDLLAIPRENIIAVTMPGFGTTNVTYENALRLVEAFGAQLQDIDIRPACLQQFKDIGHDPSVYDVTYENVQARERTQILMDIANKQNGLVIGTGDLSELALGWCTYNGDHMSMYSVNCGVPKTLVRHMARWAADNTAGQDAAAVLLKILDTPVTPELLPPDENGRIRQMTEDIIGPYELHDFFLYHTLRYGAEPEKLIFLAKRAFEGVYDADTVKSWLKIFYKRFFSQQFKRSCQPDGPRVGTVSLSPRGGWSMPSDAAAGLWLKELE